MQESHLLDPLHLGHGASFRVPEPLHVLHTPVPWHIQQRPWPLHQEQTWVSLQDRHLGIRLPDWTAVGAAFGAPMWESIGSLVGWGEVWAAGTAEAGAASSILDFDLFLKKIAWELFGLSFRALSQRSTDRL